MTRYNVIYIKAWCSHDTPLGKAVPGTPNLANGIWGRCLGDITSSFNAIPLSLLCHRYGKIILEYNLITCLDMKLFMKT